MNRLGLFALAAQASPKLFHVRRRTWILLGLALVGLLGLLIWAAIALLGWFLAQVQGWSGAAPDVAREALATVERQVEQVLPGAREKLSEVVPILRPEDRPWREVSGSDFAPVARYPGLVRVYWHREGRTVTAHYEGRADYALVLDHYVRGFASLGYAHDLRSAAPAAETHAWTKGGKHYLAKIVGQSNGVVSVHIETNLE